MVALVRSILLLLVALPATALAQPAALSTAAWNPAANYITVGQDEPGYRSWYLALPSRSLQVKAFNGYLANYQVAGIVPT